MPPGLSCPGLKLTSGIQTNSKVGQRFRLPAQKNATILSKTGTCWSGPSNRNPPRTAQKPSASGQPSVSPFCDHHANLSVRPSESDLEVSSSQFRLRFQSQFPATLGFTLIPLTHQRVSQIQERLGELRSLIDRFLIQPGSVLKMSLPMQQ